MSLPSNLHGSEHADRVVLYALRVLPASEVPAMEAHLAECSECRDQLESLRRVVGSFVSWPRAVVRPTGSLWDRLARRIAEETGEPPAPAVDDDWREPKWKQASPGVYFQLLSKDSETDRVTMLVRLDPGVRYPPHEHAGCEELHLLDGELWIDGKKLQPGDYHRAEAGTDDNRVWTETGCTCILITSHRDILK